MKSKRPNRREQRRLRLQRIVFVVFGLLIILSMLIGSFVNLY